MEDLMKRIFTLTLMSLVLIGLSVSCKHKNPEQKAQKITKRIGKKLELTPEQKEKLEKVKNKMLAVLNQKKSTKEDFNKDVKKLLIQSKMSESEIKSLLDKRRNSIDQALPEVLPEIIDFHASLNDEQKEKLVFFVEKFGLKKRGKKVKK